eukprot:1157508-Pelagomonas_calceolata.AAC.2
MGACKVQQRTAVRKFLQRCVCCMCEGLPHRSVSPNLPAMTLEAAVVSTDETFAVVTLPPELCSVCHCLPALAEMKQRLLLRCLRPLSSILSSTLSLSWTR